MKAAGRCSTRWTVPSPSAGEAKQFRNGRKSKLQAFSWFSPRENHSSRSLSDHSNCETALRRHRLERQALGFQRGIHSSAGQRPFFHDQLLDGNRELATQFEKILSPALCRRSFHSQQKAVGLDQRVVPDVLCLPQVELEW